MNGTEAKAKVLEAYPGAECRRPMQVADDNKMGIYHQDCGWIAVLPGRLSLACLWKTLLG